MKDNEELLHIYSEEGGLLAEHDLSTHAASVMIAFSEKQFSFVETASAGTPVMAALVRDEDGWTLAAADPSRPVMNGNKETTDIHLVAGLPVRLGEWVFRLERSAQEAGSALVWRAKGGSFAVDRLMAGRNIVGSDRHEAPPTVNPTLAKETLCELYPSEDGLDVVVPGSSDGRLSVGMKELFAIGDFEGMLMTAADAAEAIKSRDPFFWPSRRQRRLVKLAGFLILLIFGAAFAMNGAKARCEKLLAEPRGATEIAYVPDRAMSARSDQVTIYTITFFRSLVSVLTAEPNSTTADLIRRGELLGDNADIRRKVKFLTDVRNIQETVKSGRWDEFAKIIAGVDQEMFRICDADDFLHDARQVHDCLTYKLPRSIAEASASADAGRLEGLREKIALIFSDLDHNLFLSGDILRRERTNVERELECVSAYVKVREAVLSELGGDAPLDETPSYYRLYDTFNELVSTLGQGGAVTEIYRPVIECERGVVAEIVTRAVDRIIANEKNDEFGRFSTLLSPLADLGESVGIPSAQTDVWRVKARFAAKRLDAHYRELYSAYRLKALTDPQAAAVTLDAILAVGDVRNGFHKWALKEKARLADEQAAPSDEATESKEAK